MSKTNIAAIVGGLFLVALVGFNVLVSDGSEDNPVVTSIRGEEAEVVTKEEATTGAESLGVYADYTPASFSEAVARDDEVVLSFSAAWCPTCQALKRNIDAGIIPDGLTILELDFDTETELKRQYGVTFQHTLVHIDENGDAISRWAGSRDIDEIIAEL